MMQNQCKHTEILTDIDKLNKAFYIC